MSVPSDDMKLNDEDDKSDTFEWTALKISLSIAMFLIAGLAEIFGGWLVWAAIRGNKGVTKPWWFSLNGSLILVGYGFIPCAQPMDSFGRIYAVYGGFFIVMSFLLGWALDGDKPDLGDIVGGAIAMVGVLVVMLWPRG